MAKSFIQANAATAPGGQKLLTFESVLGADVVESEAVTITDGAGDEVAIATETTLAAIAVSVAAEGALQVGAEFTVASGAPVMLLAANPARRGFIVQNNGGDNARMGPAGVTATTGLRLLPDAIVTASPPFLPTNALWAIAEGSTTTVFAAEIV